MAELLVPFHSRGFRHEQNGILRCSVIAFNISRCIASLVPSKGRIRGLKSGQWRVGRLTGHVVRPYQQRRAPKGEQFLHGPSYFRLIVSYTHPALSVSSPLLVAFPFPVRRLPALPPSRQITLGSGTPCESTDVISAGERFQSRHVLSASVCPQLLLYYAYYHHKPSREMRGSHGGEDDGTVLPGYDVEQTLVGGRRRLQKRIRPTAVPRHAKAERGKTPTSPTPFAQPRLPGAMETRHRSSPERRGSKTVAVDNSQKSPLPASRYVTKHRLPYVKT